MAASSISVSIDDLESALSKPNVSAGAVSASLDGLAAQPWGVPDAARVASIGSLASESLAPGSSARGRALILAAKANCFQAQFGPAKEQVRLARLDFRVAKDSVGLANCSLIAGAIYSETGRQTAALRAYRRAEKLFARSLDLRGTAACIFNRGLIHFQRMELHEALDCYSRAEQVFDRLGQSLQATICRMNAGNVHNAAGRYADALEVYVQARESFDSLGDEERSARCRLNAGNALAGARKHSQALGFFERAREVFRLRGNERLEAACLLNRASSAFELGELGEAETGVRQALEVFRRLDDPIGKGECHLLLCKVTGSADDGVAAIECFERIGAKFQAASTLVQLAKLSRDSESHWLRALASVEMAVKSKDGVGLRYLAAEQFSEIAPALISKALARGDVGSATSIARRADFDGFRRQPGSNGVEVRFLADEHSLHAMIGQTGTSSFVTTPLSRERLLTVSKRFLTSLLQPDGYDEAGARELYRLLIDPLLSRIGDGVSLSLVADVTLGDIAFEALADVKGQFLVCGCPLTYGLRPAPTHAPPTNCLAITRTHFEAPFPPLTGSHEEVMALQGAVRQTDELTLTWLHQEQAGVADVKRRLARADLIHVATHAIYNPQNPFASALILEPDADHPSGYLYARDISKLRLNAKLVVLSACETASNSRSLAKAFLDAGAQQVVAGAWRAHDIAAKLWMEVFYERFFVSGEASDAHQAACKHLIGSEFSDPHYWALWRVIT